MQSRPEWLKMKAPDEESLKEMEKILRVLKLNTVCESANCPNIGKCFENKTATFMIMGDKCTRACRFCAVKTSFPNPLDPKEPNHVATASQQLGLKHIVVTSVTRDDLEDGGAHHYAETVREIRKFNPDSTIELLIPDLQGDWKALQTIIESKPHILNHNVETVPSMYSLVRPEAIFERSLELLGQVKVMDHNIYTKSGIMLGFGENEEEVIQVMKDLRKINCDILTIGQYLQPSKEHVQLKEYIPIEKFDALKNKALKMGFKYVAAGPLVRSSYKAYEGMQQMKKDVV